MGRLGTGSHCHEYAKTGVDTGCEVYVGLGANQSGFQDWYATKFVHRVLDPKIAGGVEKSESKRDTLILRALQSTRGTAPAPADADVPEIGEGAPARVISPEIEQHRRGLRRYADSSPDKMKVATMIDRQNHARCLFHCYDVAPRYRR